MILNHPSGQRLLLLGYVLYSKDIDSSMWSYRFEEFKKCPGCGFRTVFEATNPNYRPKKSGPDYGSTWDGEIIVTQRFEAFCRHHKLGGLDFLPFQKAKTHFHVKWRREIHLDCKLSDIRVTEICPQCDNPRDWLWGQLKVFVTTEPLQAGFYRTHNLIGRENRKDPAIIVSPHTRYLLQNSGLSGFLRFEPVYAVSTPALESALKSYTPLKPTRAKARGQRRTLPSQLDSDPLRKLLVAPSPAFRCAASSQTKRRILLPVHHQMGGRSTEAYLRLARQLVGPPGRLLLKLYQYHNGMELYRDNHSDEAGVRLFPIEHWAAETEAMRKIFASQPKSERPEVLSRAVAFGEPPGSGHHFALITKGRGAGSILLTNHETLSADEFAPHFNEFLKIICTDPVDLLTNQLGGYVRYRDGKSSHEWVPVEYLPDAKAASRGSKTSGSRSVR